MTPAAELPIGQVKRLAERDDRERYARALVALARKGAVPGVALGHLAVRVLLFLLGQRPGYFAHQKVIATAVDSNLTSVRGALFELREGGLVSWELIPPHHALPTGNFTRTNVNRYFVEAEALLRRLGATDAAPRTVAPTHPNSDASTGTSSEFEQDLPLPPPGAATSKHTERASRGEGRFKKEDRTAPGQQLRADQSRPPLPQADVETVLASWRQLNLGEPDDRSVRALQNRWAEGASAEQFMAAVEGARHDEWLSQGRAKSAFAVVFASIASIERFSVAGREHAQRAEAEARRRAAERRAARDRLRVTAQLSPSENAVCAEQALKALLEVVGRHPPLSVNREPRPSRAPEDHRVRSQFAPEPLADPRRSLPPGCAAQEGEPSPPATRP